MSPNCACPHFTFVMPSILLLLCLLTVCGASLSSDRSLLSRYVARHAQGRSRDLCRMFIAGAITNEKIVLGEAIRCRKNRAPCRLRQKLQGRLHALGSDPLTTPYLWKKYRQARRECAVVKEMPKCQIVTESRAKLKNFRQVSCNGTRQTTEELAEREYQVADRVRRKLGLEEVAYDVTIINSAVVFDSVIIFLHAMNQSPSAIQAYVANGAHLANRTRFILPHAGNMDVMGENIPSWFSVSPDRRVSARSVRESSRLIWHIARVQHQVYRIPYKRIFIMGASGGGVMALESFIRHSWGGGIVFSAALALASSYPPLPRALNNAPLLSFHGKNDSVIPIRKSRQSLRLLRKGGANVTAVEYGDTGHDLELSLWNIFVVVGMFLDDVLG